MKRILLTGLLLMGIGQIAAFAQNDDIYFNSSDLEKQKQEDRERAQKEARQRAEDSTYYSQSGNYNDQYNNNDQGGDYQSYNRSYDNDGYIDYSNDDYYYSSNINRFNYPFYNMGYYSSFYNPYSYNPYWYDPYWGWSPWYRPGFSISFGYGPYWNSYWGWYTWYGYPSYYSYYNYPCYGSFYGDPYYSGYWNGYYAGLYNNSYHKPITYGPRNSTNYAYNTNIRTTDLRRPLNTTTGGLRESNGNRISQPAGNTPLRTGQPVIRENGAVNTERPVRQQFTRDEEYNPVNREDVRSPSMQESPRYEAPRQQPVRIQQSVPREQPRMEQLRYEAPQQRNNSFQSAPRMESPRMNNSGFSPSRSSGGSNFGGGGRTGGSFGGRR